MTIRILNIVFVFGLFVACNNETKRKDLQGDDNLEINEIVNIVFDATVGPDTLWTKHVLIPPAFLLLDGHETETNEIENYSKSIDNLKLKLDTTELYVFINDSLVKFSENRSRLSSVTELQTFKLNFPEIDTIFRTLLIKLMDSSVSRPLDLSKLKSKYNYQIDYISNKDKYPSSIVKIGSVKMSNLVFNNNLTMACIYSEIVCGGECGGGSILFLRKVNGHWKIEEQKELWVS